MTTPHGESTSSSLQNSLLFASSAQSAVEADDCSGVQRNQKLEDMRARVERQLENLVKGSEENFQSLRQQVAELRTCHVEDSPTRSVPSIQQEINFVPSPMKPELSPGGTSSGLDSNSLESLRQSSQISEALSLPEPSLASVSLAAPSIESAFSSVEEPLPEQVTPTPPSISQVDSHRVTDPYGDNGMFSGTLKHGKPHGSGVMVYNDSRTYSGAWRDGHWHGQGRVVFANGDIYEGSYEKDQRHGFGVYQWNDGRRYEGEFARDQREGLGEYRWPDGSMYKGFFRNGHREGEGTYVFGTGDCYTGEWKRGKYHGLGECVWATGRSYKGEWFEGKAHGYGIETRKDGTIRHGGQWNQDVPIRDKKKR